MKEINEILMEAVNASTDNYEEKKQAFDTLISSWAKLESTLSVLIHHMDLLCDCALQIGETTAVGQFCEQANGVKWSLDAARETVVNTMPLVESLEPEELSEADQMEVMAAMFSALAAAMREEGNEKA